MPESFASTRFPFLLPALALALLLLPIAPSLAAQEAEAVEDEVQCASLAYIEEEGHFTIYQNEEALVRIEHTWRKDGSFTGHAVLTMAGQTAEWTLEVATGATGQWTTIESGSPLGEVVATREGNEAVVAAGDQDPARLTLRPGTTLFDNYQPALLRLVIAAYDREAGGEQQIPMFIAAGAVFDVGFELLETTERTVGGDDLRLDRFRLAFPDTEMFVWGDADGRVLAVEVPSQFANFVRDGFESVLVAPEVDPLLSAPDFEWTLEDDVMVPMRDGVHLSTDIYLPEGKGRYPVVLVRTPYKKELLELQGKFYARRGYVYAVQDCRGRFGSEGTWVPFFDEPEDGYDTVEWLAAQEYTTDKVGMIGGSYSGWVQWWAARERPPHLTTLIPNVAPLRASRTLPGGCPKPIGDAV